MIDTIVGLFNYSSNETNYWAFVSFHIGISAKAFAVPPILNYAGRSQ